MLYFTRDRWELVLKSIEVSEQFENTATISPDVQKQSLKIVGKNDHVAQSGEL